MSTKDPNDLSGEDISQTTPLNAKDRLATDAMAIRDTAKADFEAIKTEAETQVEALRTEAGEQVESLKHKAQDQISDATDKARTFAGEQKNLAAEQLSGVATALGRVADELQTDQSSLAGYTRQMADGLTRFADTVKTRQVDDIVALAQNFGRKQPAAFLGAAAVAGFLASRFAAASSHRASKGKPDADEGNEGVADTYTSPSGLDAAPLATNNTGVNDVQR